MNSDKECSVAVTASPPSENETAPVVGPIEVAPPPDGGAGWIQVFVGQ